MERKRNILITGGAGYIGSHLVRLAIEEGYNPIVLDDLSTGEKSFVPDTVPLIELSTTAKPELLSALFIAHEIDAVIHLAGFKAAGVSVQTPLQAYDSNVVGVIHLLQAMELVGVNTLVNSSSAAVYGQPESDALILESAEKAPLSPYGESKLMSEWIIASHARASVGFTHTSLRYFNVVGSGYPELYDKSAHNLFPLVFSALTAGKNPLIYGDDFETPDGTCVRDYIHVQELAAIHLKALEKLFADEPLSPAYNLGSGSGTSVLEIMTTVALVTGLEFTPKVVARRAGDPARIVASASLAAEELGWNHGSTLDKLVESAWLAHLKSNAS